VSALSSTFADVLRACRGEMNARFAAVRREFTDLEAEAYFEFLRSSGNAVVRAVGAAMPAAVVETGRVVCEAGMDLVARNLAGPKAVSRALDEAWQRVLPAAARQVAAEPRRVIAAVSNAVHQVATTAGARAVQWMECMEKVAPLAGNADMFLRAGQVAAWRSGLAHFRDGALAVAASLPGAVALAALGTEGDAAEILQQLEQDPWFDPSAPQKGTRLVARAGAFRGYGGLFIAPPVVSLRHGQWLASSGGEHWLLTADAFGATFHRVVGHDIPAVARSARVSVPVPADCGEVTSTATLGATTAVTASLTHAVLFYHAA
jgi:hypothetical protein